MNSIRQFIGFHTKPSEKGESGPVLYHAFLKWTKKKVRPNCSYDTFIRFLWEQYPSTIVLKEGKYIYPRELKSIQAIVELMSPPLEEDLIRPPAPPKPKPKPKSHEELVKIFTEKELTWASRERDKVNLKIMYFRYNAWCRDVIPYPKLVHVKEFRKLFEAQGRSFRFGDDLSKRSNFRFLRNGETRGLKIPKEFRELDSVDPEISNLVAEVLKPKST